MTAIRVEVTAEHIAEAGEQRNEWAAPIEAALAGLTGQEVSIDGDDDGNVATIGQDAWTLVVELPEAANSWLVRRWNGDPDDRLLGSEPITFELEIPTWVTDLVRAAVEVSA